MSKYSHKKLFKGLCNIIKRIRMKGTQMYNLKRFHLRTFSSQENARRHPHSASIFTFATTGIMNPRRT